MRFIKILAPLWKLRCANTHSVPVSPVVEDTLGQELSSLTTLGARCHGDMRITQFSTPLL